MRWSATHSTSVLVPPSGSPSPHPTAPDRCHEHPSHAAAGARAGSSRQSTRTFPRLRGWTVRWASRRWRPLPSTQAEPLCRRRCCESRRAGFAASRAAKLRLTLTASVGFPLLTAAAGGCGGVSDALRCRGADGGCCGPRRRCSPPPGLWRRPLPPPTQRRRANALFSPQSCRLIPSKTTNTPCLPPSCERISPPKHADDSPLLPTLASRVREHVHPAPVRRPQPPGRPG